MLLPPSGQPLQTRQPRRSIDLGILRPPTPSSSPPPAQKARHRVRRVSTTKLRMPEQLSLMTGSSLVSVVNTLSSVHHTSQSSPLPGSSNQQAFSYMYKKEKKVGVEEVETDEVLLEPRSIESGVVLDPALLEGASSTIPTVGTRKKIGQRLFGKIGKGKGSRLAISFQELFLPCVILLCFSPCRQILSFCK